MLLDAKNYMKTTLLNFLASCLAICSLISCNQHSNKSLINNTIEKKVNSTSKPAIKMPAVQKFNLDNFPKKWTELTEVDGEKIIQNPCDAVNGAFTFRKTKGHGYIMNCDGGQDDIDYKLISYSSKPDTIELVGESMISKENIVFTITKMDTIANTAHWEWTDMDWSGRRESKYMVTNRGKSKFRVVNEPPCL